MRIRQLIAAAGLAAGVVACGEPEPDALTKYADQICACKTVECADKILPRFEKWAAEHGGKEIEGKAAERLNAQLARAQQCYDQLGAK